LWHDLNFTNLTFVPIKVMPDNKKLINTLIKNMKEHNLNRGYVYEMYVKLAVNYYLKDLEYIKQQLSYERHWITIKSRELAKTDCWQG